MLKVKLFVNQLMSSNCYVISDDRYPTCIVVDPGSEKSEALISYIDKFHLVPEYVLLTHEHTDHTWGVNVMIDNYDSKIVCSAACEQALQCCSRAYFQFYYDDPGYEYKVKRVDILLEEINWHLLWNGYHVRFIHTPGHSNGSTCISMENILFTGDTIMLYKRFLPKRSGGDVEKLKHSVMKILDLFDGGKTIVFPGHGESFLLQDVVKTMDLDK